MTWRIHVLLSVTYVVLVSLAGAQDVVTTVLLRGKAALTLDYFDITGNSQIIFADHNAFVRIPDIAHPNAAGVTREKLSAAEEFQPYFSGRTLPIAALSENTFAVGDQYGLYKVTSPKTIVGLSGTISQGARAPAPSFPLAVVSDSSNNLYVVHSNSSNALVLRIDSKTGYVSTFAGVPGKRGYNGDNKPAVEALLDDVFDIAIDSKDNVYIVDTDNDLIRKITPQGIIVNVAGMPGQTGHKGDGGPPLEATFQFAASIAVDTQGNIYVGDNESLRVRKIDVAANRIDTIAGTGASGRSGDGGDPLNATFKALDAIKVDTDGMIYVADTLSGTVRRIDPARNVIERYAGTTTGFGGDEGPAIDAQLSSPIALSFDKDHNLYIADQANNRIRRVNHASGIINTVAGSGPDNSLDGSIFGDGSLATEAGLDQPVGVAIGTQGEIFLADFDRIRVVYGPFGLIQTYPTGFNRYVGNGDGGDAVNAILRFPSACISDAAGNLYISDSNANCIRKVDGVTHQISTLVDALAAIQAPRALAFDNEDGFFICDSTSNCIRRFDLKLGTLEVIAGNGQAGFGGDGGPATLAQLNFPTGIAYDANAAIVYVGDYTNFRVRAIDLAQKTIRTVAGNTETPLSAGGIRLRPVDVALDGRGGLLIADDESHVVARLDLVTKGVELLAGTGSAGPTGDGGPATSAQLDNPLGVALDLDGSVLIVDGFNNRIRRVDAETGIIDTIAGTGIGGFSGDGGPAIKAQLSRPRYISLDANGNYIITDRGNARIRKIDRETGIISTIAGQLLYDDKPLAFTTNLVVRNEISADSLGNIYGADQIEGIVWKYDAASQRLERVAGNGSPEFGGDGGPAGRAGLNSPRSAVADDSGNIYIADCLNNRVRRVDALTGIISTIAGTGEEKSSGDGGLAVNAAVALPNSVAIRGGILYVGGNFVIRAIDLSSGFIWTVKGIGTCSGEHSPAMSNPLHIETVRSDPSGLYFTGFLYSLSRVSEGVVGSHRDTDLDGFSDSIETAAKTNANDPSSTPASVSFSDYSLNYAFLRFVDVFSIRSSSTSKTADRVVILNNTVNSSYPIDTFFGQTGIVDVGGFSKTFKVDAKGRISGDGCVGRFYITSAGTQRLDMSIARGQCLSMRPALTPGLNLDAFDSSGKLIVNDRTPSTVSVTFMFEKLKALYVTIIPVQYKTQNRITFAQGFGATATSVNSGGRVSGK